MQVKYLGAAPVGGRVASVRGLQEPLRQLLEHIDQSVPAELEISRRGLTFRTSEIYEKTNPFRRIAVWSALRLSCRSSPEGDLYHAFLPLVGDDQSPPRGATENKHADLYRSMKGLETGIKKYPPIFAVVMRRPGAARLLECHAFACGIEEDAIAAAATLYRALLADLDSNRRRPRQSNGLGCVSLASVASSLPEPSIIGASKNIFGTHALQPRPSPPLLTRGTPGHPVRPPRSKKTSLSGSQGDRSSVKSMKFENSPRRKKISEIKAEDILEARSRKAPPTNSRVAALKELRDGSTSSGHTNSNNKTRNTRTRNEERNNFRNKMIYQENNSVNDSVKSGDEKLVYDEKNVYALRRLNNYEKLPKISNGFGSYADQPEVNYSFVEKNGNIVGEVIVKERDDDCYERNSGFYEFSNRLDGQYIGQPGPEDVISSNGTREEVQQISRANSLYENKSQSGKTSTRVNKYEEHFRDADKIYSLGQEDLTMSNGKRRNSKTRHSQSAIEENFSFSRGPANKIGSDREEDAFGRVSRINTMDKPTRKQMQSGYLEVTTKECGNVTKVRKRSRAGSEPPVSRTEDAMKHSQEARLKRSQSDLEVEKGDPMTRVELPRRGSFLKPGSTRLPNNLNGGTPLGFTELFDEFRNQEGLTSVDDILTAIIGKLKR